MNRKTRVPLSSWMRSFRFYLFLASILVFTSACRERDIVVVEDSANDNGYLTGKANGFPDAVRATSKQDMVDKVLARLGKWDCIKTLTLIGHGSPGNISVGDGQGWENCKHIDGNRDEWEPLLAQLKKRFCKNAKLVLFGCHTGACDEGATKLQALADFLGVTVEAPTGEVYGDCTEEEGSEHQVARPGQPKPEHKASPSDMVKQNQPRDLMFVAVPFSIDSLTGIAVYPARGFPKITPEQVEYDYTTKDSIRKFIGGIDFSKKVEKAPLGTDYDAYVYMKFRRSVTEYTVFCDFDYLFPKTDPKTLYDIRWELKQQLRAIVRQKRQQ